MPHIDARSGELVIRIVYDGAPEAGKTTNVHQLGNTISLQRRGAAKSPGTTGARTEFFDWLDFSGGYVDGRRVRCQLVSVPGQAQLLHRRRYLLERADAVVFVADSRPNAFGEAAQNFATTLRLLRRVEGDAPIGLVIQANKQDLPDALAPVDVSARLGADATTPVIGTVASTGQGVMQAFVLAAQLAIERARIVVEGRAPLDLGVTGPEAQDSPDTLHQQLLQVDAAEQPTSAAAEADDIQSDSSLLPPPRGNLLTRVDQMELPLVDGMSTGQVWPPVAGRVIFANASFGPLAIPKDVQAWAPREPYEIVARDAWYLHSSPHWLFTHESDARHALLTQARKVAGLGPLAPRSRAIAVGKDGEGWRLYIATSRIATVADQALAASASDPLALRKWIGQVISGWSLLRTHDLAATIALNQLAIDDGCLVLLAIPEAGQPYSSIAHAPLPALWMLLEARLRLATPQRQWWTEEGRARLGRAAEEMP